MLRDVCAGMRAPVEHSPLAKHDAPTALPTHILLAHIPLKQSVVARHDSRRGHQTEPPSISVSNPSLIPVLHVVATQ